MRLNGWQNIKTEEVKSPHECFNPDQYKRYAFSGIHLLSPDIFKWMESWNGKFPIMDFYLNLCGEIPIGAFNDDQLKMVDVGKIETLEKAEEFVIKEM
jgi:NDP-sugar pyrophosphorylase family protein